MEQHLWLPWPGTDLSPNTRQHWARLARARKSYRRDCAAVSLSQRVDRIRVAGPVALALEFRPPSRRHYDADNLVARMKAGLDGLSDAIQLDDRNFALASVSIGEPIQGGRVDIQMSWDGELAHTTPERKSPELPGAEVTW